MTGRVSVALATFGGAKYVEQQLLSILDQTRPVDEIVIADDGSTDETLATIESLRSRIEADGIALTVLEAGGARRGVTQNFARAIAATSGDVLLLSDQDDVWRPDKTERLLREFANPAVGAAASDARLIDGAGTPMGATLFETLPVTPADRAAVASDDAFLRLLPRNLMTGATMAVRRRVALDAAPFPPGWVHDEWLAVVAALFGRTVIVDETLMDYRQHGANEIGVTSRTLRRRIARVLEPGAQRNARLVQRAEALVDRMAEWGDRVPVRFQDAAQGKLAHDRDRAGLPRSRVRRIPRVVRLATRGGYSRFSSQGRLDIVRDLLQPP